MTTTTTTKGAYHYSDAGQYLGLITAFLDKAATEREGEAVFILPSSSTFTPIPEEIPLYHSAKFNVDLDSWEIVADYSQTLLWDKKTASPVRLGFMEPLLANLTVQKPLDVEAGFVNYFNQDTNSWSLIPDLRGQTFYKKSSGERVVIDEIAPLSIELTDKVKPDQLYYVWDEAENNWVIDKVLKQEFVIAQNTAKKSELKVAAEDRIVLLERKEKMKRATPEDLALLELIYIYTFDLADLDLTQENLVFPAVP